MKVTITFKDNIIKKINSKLNEVKRYTSRRGTMPVISRGRKESD